MNLVDGYVTKVLSEPLFNDKYAAENMVWWEVNVEYDSYGRISTQKLTFKTEEEVQAVQVGYHFLT